MRLFPNGVRIDPVPEGRGAVPSPAGRDDKSAVSRSGGQAEGAEVPAAGVQQAEVGLAEPAADRHGPGEPGC